MSDEIVDVICNHRCNSEGRWNVRYYKLAMKVEPEGRVQSQIWQHATRADQSGEPVKGVLELEGEGKRNLETVRKNKDLRNSWIKRYRMKGINVILLNKNR